MVILMAVIFVMIWVTESRFHKQQSSLSLLEKLIIPPNHFEGATFENQPVVAAIEKKLKADWTINGRYRLESGKSSRCFPQRLSAQSNKACTRKFFVIPLMPVGKELGGTGWMRSRTN